MPSTKKVYLNYIILVSSFYYCLDTYITQNNRKPIDHPSDISFKKQEEILPPPIYPPLNRSPRPR